VRGAFVDETLANVAVGFALRLDATGDFLLFKPAVGAIVKKGGSCKTFESGRLRIYDNALSG
jgi:hypothetical protein